jgi:hypothetical protein
VARDRHPAVATSPKAVRWSWARGLMATGSYEEPLLMEGIPDHHGARRSRGALTNGLGGHRILATRANLPKGDARPQSSSRETSRGARVKRGGRDRGVRGSIASASWEHNAHAPYSKNRKIRRGRVECRWTIRRSGKNGRRETLGPPVLPRGALVSVGCPRCESGERSWERTRCGCTQVVWVADIGWTH